MLTHGRCPLDSTPSKEINPTSNQPKNKMTHSESWSLYMALTKAKKTELGISDAQVYHRTIEGAAGGEVKVIEGIVYVRVVDARSGNGETHEFRGRAPLMHEIVAQVEILRDNLVSKAKSQRAAARAIRADSR